MSDEDKMLAGQAPDSGTLAVGIALGLGAYRLALFVRQLWRDSRQDQESAALTLDQRMLRELQRKDDEMERLRATHAAELQRERARREALRTMDDLDRQQMAHLEEENETLKAQVRQLTKRLEGKL